MHGKEAAHIRYAPQNYSKMKYIAPKVIKIIKFVCENNILAGSVIDTKNTEIKTAGQEVQTFDFSDCNWE